MESPFDAGRESLKVPPAKGKTGIGYSQRRRAGRYSAWDSHFSRILRLLSHPGVFVALVAAVGAPPP
jgi:hypothetical protein